MSTRLLLLLLLFGRPLLFSGSLLFGGEEISLSIATIDDIDGLRTYRSDLLRVSGNLDKLGLVIG